MNITREDAVKLPTGDISIIATIYEKWHSTDLKTGEVKDDFERVYLAQGYQNADNPEEFIFHLNRNEEGFDCIGEEVIGLNGYTEDVWHDTGVYEIDEHTLEYRLFVVTDYIINTGIEIKNAHTCKVSDTQDIDAFDSVILEFRTPKGKILWESSEITE